MAVETSYDDNACLSIVQGRKVVVIGYGSQGRALDEPAPPRRRCAYRTHGAPDCSTADRDDRGILRMEEEANALTRGHRGRAGRIAGGTNTKHESGESTVRLTLTHPGGASCVVPLRYADVVEVVAHA